MTDSDVLCESLQFALRCSHEADVPGAETFVDGGPSTSGKAR